MKSQEEACWALAAPPRAPRGGGHSGWRDHRPRHAAAGPTVRPPPPSEHHPLSPGRRPRARARGAERWPPCRAVTPRRRPSEAACRAAGPGCTSRSARSSGCGRAPRTCTGGHGPGLGLGPRGQKAGHAPGRACSPGPSLPPAWPARHPGPSVGTQRQRGGLTRPPGDVGAECLRWAWPVPGGGRGGCGTVGPGGGPNGHKPR